MNAEKKQALIERCKTISSWREKYGDFSNVMLPAIEAQEIAQIALAALTAQPVKLPKGFNPAIGDILDRAAPVMRRDASDGKWLHKADVTKILNELGHEVQE